MADTTDDGRTVEVISREGIVGVNIFLGGVDDPTRGRWSR
jgi:hypothetical protein